MKLIAIPFLCAGLVTTGVAWGQAQIVPKDEELKGPGETDVVGVWNPFLGVTSTIALTSNSNVVGQVDGFSTLFGLGVTAGADYVHGAHLFRSTLSISENFARTPVIEEFVKTNDVVKLEGLYNYFLTRTLGVFGRLSLSTSAFPADDVRGVETSWVERNPDGAPIPLGQMVLRQRLAGSFSPFTINESVGVFAEPLRKENFNLSVRFGLGGRHTFADGVLILDDDKATPEVELNRLNNVHQLGVEAFAGAIGKTADGRASYRAGLAALMPFVNNDEDNRSATDLTRIGFEGNLTFNVYSWMGLVYSLNITRDPQIFNKGDEKVQVQNNLLLSFQFSVVKKKEAEKKKSKEALELEEAKKRNEELERRAKEAEDKLRERGMPGTEPSGPIGPSEPTEPMPSPTPTPNP